MLLTGIRMVGFEHSEVDALNIVAGLLRLIYDHIAEVLRHIVPKKIRWDAKACHATLRADERQRANPVGVVVLSHGCPKNIL